MLKRYFVVYNGYIQISRENQDAWGYKARSYRLNAHRLRWLNLPASILELPPNGKIVASGTKI